RGCVDGCCAGRGVVLIGGGRDGLFVYPIITFVVATGSQHDRHERDTKVDQSHGFFSVVEDIPISDPRFPLECRLSAPAFFQASGLSESKTPCSRSVASARRLLSCLILRCGNT